jgi:hypothetical protein
MVRGVSFRGTCVVVDTLKAAGLIGKAFSQAPHWTTVRWWVLRLGYYELHREKERADDWVWLVDHSNQIGREKFLGILGVRLAHLPPAGQALRLSDLQLLELQPVVESDKQVVFQQLEALARKTGVPRAILHDWGGDLAGGTALFRQAHPETSELYDVAHKAACLLKRLLEKDKRFQQFGAQAGAAKCQLQQTELAFLVPPRPREKARFMNLQSLMTWARKSLAILQAPPERLLPQVTPRRLDDIICCLL